MASLYSNAIDLHRFVACFSTTDAIDHGPKKDTASHARPSWLAGDSNQSWA